MGSSSVTLAFRPFAIEDCWPNYQTTLGQATFPVLGPGSVPITPIVSAISDAAALATGLTYGDVYLDTGVTPMRLRAITASQSAATAYFGSNNLTPGSILDAEAVYLGTITDAGTILGSAAITSSPSIATTGVRVVSKPVSAGLVGVEVWNLSGGTVTIGPVAFNSDVIASTGAGGALSKVSYVATITTGSAITSGSVLSLGSFSLGSIQPGMCVLVNTNPALPTGVAAFGYVSAANTMTLEIWNLSQSTFASGAVLSVSANVLVDGSSAAAVNELLGSYTLTLGTIPDGCVSVGVVGIPGCVPANTAIVQATTAFPTGVQAIGKVISAGMVAIELWNISGGTYTPGAVTFNVTVLQ